MADRLDDLICAFHPDATAMETLGILLLGWIIFLSFLTLVAKFIYSKVIEVNTSVADTKTETKRPPPIVPIAATHISSEQKAAVLEALKQPSIAAKKLGTRGRSKSRDTSRESSRERETALSDVIAGPDEVSVKWVNDILSWLKTHPKQLEQLREEFRNGLNETAKNCEAETGVLVEVTQVVFPETPNLQNIFVECSPADNVTVTCDVVANFIICVQTRLAQKDRSVLQDFRVKIEPLRARLNVAFTTEDTKCTAKFDGWPEITPKLVLATARETLPKDELQVQDIVLETLTAAVRRSTLNLTMMDYDEFPNFVRPLLPNEPILPVHYDSMMLNATKKDPLISAAPGKKLLVKIIKATALGSGRKNPSHKVSCVVEMDDPPQRHQTAIKEDGVNPTWDEQFLFDLRPTTAEILFEVEERSKNFPEFLGLGIVGIEELLMHPSQIQIIQLQARPYENDPVSGSLTVEFVFVDGNAPLVDRKLHAQQKTGPTGNVFTSKLIFSRNPEAGIGNLFSRKKKEKNSPDKDPDPADMTQRPSRSKLERTDSYNRALRNGISEFSLVNGSDPVTESALRELRQRKNAQDGRTGTPTKSTLIIHSVQKRPKLPTVLVELSSTCVTAMKAKGEEGPLAVGDVSPTSDVVFSLGLPNVHDSTASSISSAGESNLLVVPGTNGMKEADSSRSLSAHSNASNSSQKTFIHANSMLVLETVETGVTKHYLIPMTLAEKKRSWGRKGTKLHIFNDHIFIAKHLPGGTVCDVCKTPISRRLGKQGYECRDCQLKCHKPCHVKTETLCPLSTVHHLELEYIQDAPPPKKA
ncbi:C2 domain-containing protein 2-like [Artemia franciscana]|uniref:C2 domain-containing protein 2-like n=1 Tax=Artemia franciscana TaxID=6661 RepID=UPI0032DBA3F1